MATHSSILAWRIPMDRGAYWATVHRVAESDTTEATKHSHEQLSSLLAIVLGDVSGALIVSGEVEGALLIPLEMQPCNTFCYSVHGLHEL